MMNDNDDYGVINEEEAAMFLNNVRKTENVVRAAQKERGAREGELVVRAVMEHFWVKENGGRNSASSVPPKPESRDKRDGSGKYNAGIPLQATIEDFDRIIDGACEKRTDGEAGWRIKWTLSYFAQSEAFLVNPADGTPTARTVAAWKAAAADGSLPNDPLSVRIRQCVTRDGVLVKELWTNVVRGESARFKGPDNNPKDNLLRMQSPSGAYLVQQSSPLIFQNVVPTIYVTYDEAPPIPSSGSELTGVPALPPTGGAPKKGGAATAATAGNNGAKKKEASLGMIYCYECKGSVLLRENKEAADLCASERMHLARNKDAHQLVPIQTLRSGAVDFPKSVYFYVPPRYITRWNPEHPEFWPKGSQGISLFRNTLQLQDIKSAPTASGEVFYSFVLDMAVFQWKDKPNTQERYVVNARVRRDDDNAWRSWGITNGEAYAAIMLANQDIPFHCVLNFWKKATLERPANDSKEMNRNEGTENIRGYYDFIVDNVVPDYRRYFPARGMQVSRTFVEREFGDWRSMHVKSNTITLALEPYGKMHKRDNPLHLLQGLSSAVISLGNGQPPPPDLPADWPRPSKQEGYYHGCKGDITHLLAPDGRYQFYVLTSRPLTEDERARYCGASATATPEEADAWLNEQIERAAKSQSAFYYWIFALDTRSKLAPPPKASPKAELLVTTTRVSGGDGSGGGGVKRDRETTEQEEQQQQQQGSAEKKAATEELEEEEEYE